MSMIRRIAIDIILIIMFSSLAVTLIQPLLAEIQFNTAQRLVASFRWPKAEMMFEKAIKTYPFNSQYPAGLAEFLLREAIYLNYKIPYLKKAEDLYNRALELNPRNASYAVKLGQIQLAIFLESGSDQTALIESAFENFKRAILNDPNGFNVSHEVGYAGIAVWHYLDEARRELVSERLKCALKLRQWYSKYIYTALWKKTKDFKLLQRITPEGLQPNRDLYAFLVSNNLWQFSKGQIAAVNFYFQKEENEKFKKELSEKQDLIKSLKRSLAKNKQPSDITTAISQEDWQGKSGGAMYWNGTIYALANMKEGEADISIKAKKYLTIKAKDPKTPKFYPYMIVALDDKEIGETFVANDDWQDYKFSVKTDGGLKILSVSFVNDIYMPDKEEDRNLLVGDVAISYK